MYQQKYKTYRGIADFVIIQIDNIQGPNACTHDLHHNDGQISDGPESPDE